MQGLTSRIYSSILSAQYWANVSIISKATIKQEFGSSFLSNIWLIIRPFILISVLAIILSRITRFDGADNYPFYLTVNLVLWIYISSVMSASTSSILGRASIFKFTPISKTIFILVDIIKFTKIYLISLFLVVVIVGYYTGATIHTSYLLFPVYFMLLLISLFSISIIFAYITPYFRDLKFLVEALMPAFMWLTPIMYPISAIDGILGTILSYSPFTIVMRPFTSILYYGEIPTIDDHIKLFIILILLITTAIFVYKKLARNVVYYL